MSSPPYFDGPFSVRNTNGQPFQLDTSSSNTCAQPRKSAYVLGESGYAHVHAHGGQREQRHSGTSNLDLHEANSLSLNKDMSNMTTLSPRATLKRKHSETSLAPPEPKRFRTFSEPRYPFHIQPKEALSLSELNPLLLRIYQGPEAFDYNINGFSKHFNPLHMANHDVDRPETVQRPLVRPEEPSLSYPPWSIDSPSSLTDREQTDGSSEIVASVETPLSSHLSPNEYKQVYDRSRGPSFSPITTKGSSPEVDVYVVANSGIDPNDIEQGLGTTESGTSSIDLTDHHGQQLDDNLALPSARAAGSLSNDHVQGPRNPLTEDGPLFERACDASTTASMPAQQESQSYLQIREPEEEVATETISSLVQKPVGLIKLRFTDKTAFARVVEGLQEPKEPSRREPEITTDVMGRYQLRSELFLPTDQFEPSHDSTDDQRFVEQVKIVLKAQGKWKTMNVARRSARRIGELLEVAEPPNISEALFLTGDEAAQYLQTGKFFEGPIVTQDQQPLPLQTPAEFLNEYYDDEATVWIQDPAVPLARNVPHAREITIGKLKARFNQDAKAKIPWNCLEMATHVEDGLRPAFLNNEDCRLLTKLKLPSSADSASRRGYEPGWKEVEKWALLAQGGALTEPHQDSHGYGTYITLNTGAMGFGWLSNPTAAERRAWRRDPATYKDGRWRYVVLRPGQTVYFPSGTVHFVFRLASVGDTLAFGGHVLRCSQIVRWVECMLEEQRGSDITNEYLSVSALAYLERVEKFVMQALQKGTVDRWGGVEAIERFLELKEEFVGTRY